MMSRLYLAIISVLLIAISGGFILSGIRGRKDGVQWVESAGYICGIMTGCIAIMDILIVIMTNYIETIVPGLPTAMIYLGILILLVCSIVATIMIQFGGQQVPIWLNR